jgi:hypothetical protein
MIFIYRTLVFTRWQRSVNLYKNREESHSVLVNSSNFVMIQECMTVQKAFIPLKGHCDRPSQSAILPVYSRSKLHEIL